LSWSLEERFLKESEEEKEKEKERGRNIL